MALRVKKSSRVSRSAATDRKPGAAEVKQTLQSLGLAAVSLPEVSPSWKRVFRDKAKSAFFQVYRRLQRTGWNLFPVHYYTSEPSVVELESSLELWAKPSALGGLNTSPKKQLFTLSQHCKPFRSEYAENLSFAAGTAGAFGPGFGYVEAQCLHAMVRAYRPKKIVEIGSGVSSLVSLVASKMNHEEDGTPCQITCVEPFPSSALKQLSSADSNLIIRQEMVQATPLDFFAQLGRNDILFIDSSHVAKAGSDVIHIVLEILPTLASGVVVHVHDIYLPFHYQRDVLQTFTHNNETPLMQAFLAFNSKFEVLFALSQMHYDFPKDLAELFPGYRHQPGERGMSLGKPGHFPSSLWLRVK